MSSYFDFEEAEGFATGAIGEPGSRTFYVQIRGEGRTISVKCEKQQIAALSEYLRNMLADLPDTGKIDVASATLHNPIEQDFILGSVGLGVDRAAMRMVVQLEEMVLIENDDDLFELLEDVDDEEDDSTVVRVLLTPEQTRAFCDTADLFLNAGRETCKWCGQPKDAQLHACPKFN